MPVDLTLFANIYTRRTDFRKAFPRAGSSAKAWFYDLASKPLARKEDAGLFSPCIYKDGTTRAKSMPTHIGSLIAMDVDDVTVDFTDLQAWVAAKVGGYACLCYSTASARADSLKFRLVFPLTTRVAAADYDRFWHALKPAPGDCVGCADQGHFPAVLRAGDVRGQPQLYLRSGGGFHRPCGSNVRYGMADVRPQAGAPH